MPWKKTSKEKLREQLVRAILAKEDSVAELSRQFGVTRRIAYKFLRRFERFGKEGLSDRPRRPKVAMKLEPWRKVLVELREARPTWGAHKLRWLMQRTYPRQHLPGERTLQRWLKQEGLVRYRVRKEHYCGPVQGPWTKPRRSNDVWTIDFKGWFKTQVGEQVEPLTVRDLHSRFVLAIELTKNKGVRPVQQVLTKLFVQYGLPKVMRSDRGSPFCGSGPYGFTQLSLWCYRLGIKIEFIDRPRRQHNNEHEQMHRVLQEEVGAHPKKNRQAQLRELHRWQNDYNHGRPHDALGTQPPAQRYRKGGRKMPRLRVPTYPANWLVLTVKKSGNVVIKGRSYSIGRAFFGLPVGFKRVGKSYQVYFQRLRLGSLDPKGTSIRPVSIQGKG